MGEGAHGYYGIAEDAEIGTAALALDGVGVGGLAGVEVGEEGGGEVAAGGGADDADAVGIDCPIGGMGADVTHGAGDIEEHGGVMVALAAEAIGEDEAGDAALIDDVAAAEA